jgi:hypothetical protein
MMAEGDRGKENKYCLTYQPTKKYDGEPKVQPETIGFTGLTRNNVDHIATLELAKKKTYQLVF